MPRLNKFPSTQSIMGGRVFCSIPESVFAVLSRRAAVVLAKLSAEVLYIVIAASLSDFPDGIFRIFQQILSAAKSSLNDIIHAGGTELLPVKCLGHGWHSNEVLPPSGSHSRKAEDCCRFFYAGQSARGCEGLPCHSGCSP